MMDVTTKTAFGRFAQSMKKGQFWSMLELDAKVIEVTGAEKINRSERVQSLWSGYGEIRRYFLEGGKYPSVIVKHVVPPDEHNHPKGWHSDFSHVRKLKSYKIEQHWYEDYAQKLEGICKVADSYYSQREKNAQTIILEDLNASGFPNRLTPSEVRVSDAKNCLSWLARFHARFLSHKPAGLWEKGTYWHLDTRPEEWKKMQNYPLKRAAKAIDEKLQSARYQTFVHGDAKLANFCFGDSDEVAVVDFQYVGKGCGMKDVAYFISSCFEESDCERYEQELLDHYFQSLEIAMGKSHDFQKLKSEWLSFYSFAWADFYRFLDGWSPGHWKMHAYSQRLVDEVLETLQHAS